MSLAEVSGRLLLSSAQVHGLEQGQPGAFHNAVFFAKALRKYASLLGVTSPLMSHVLVTGPSSPAVSDEGPFAQVEGTGRGVPAVRRAFLSRSAVVTGLVIACGVGVTLYRRPTEGDRVQSSSTNPLPGTGAPASTSPPLAGGPQSEMVPSTSATAGQAQPLDLSAGSVALSRAAWVYVRYADNRIFQRMLPPGGSLSLTSVPVYLAIGAIDGVTLTLGGRTVDLKPFTQNGEIRLRAADLAALAASQR